MADERTPAEYFAAWVDEVGGPERAKEILGYTSGAIRHWMHEVRQINPDRAVDLEYKTQGRLDRVSLVFGPGFSRFCVARVEDEAAA